jgi:hypothetical protein
MGRAMLIMMLVALAGIGVVQAGQRPKSESPKPLGPSELAATGKWCLTGQHAILTSTRFEAVEAMHIAGSGDPVAWQKLFAEGKAAQLMTGLRVYVMETSWPFARIRLEGQTGSGWTGEADLEHCKYP